MRAGISTSADSSIFEANVSTLATVLPDSASAIREAIAPTAVEPSVGRDGSDTYTWREADGTMRWLGRTSMPSVSGPALVDAFQPGSGNVLFYSMGHGLEALLMLARLRPHQAVMVVEPNAWAAALAMRLYDFSPHIRTGRLLLFTGPMAWEQLETFLLEHTGYLEPQRVLSWPWFDTETITEVTQRIGAVNGLVSQRRMETRETGTQLTIGDRESTSPGLAILSNVGEPATWRLAGRLAHAAAQLDWRVESFVMKDPSRVHPLAIERALKQLRPALCIAIDTTPEAFGCRLPEGPICIWWTQSQAPNESFLTQLGPKCLLAAATPTIREAVARAGFPADRIVVVPPAGCPSGISEEKREGKGIAIIADSGDVTAKSVGLHLATHARLWEAVVEVVRERCDRYVDEDAEHVLHAAEARLKIRIDSDEVRQGIVARIRRQIGSVVAREYLTTLHASGVAFALFGDGWAGETAMAEHWRGPWPEPEQLCEQLADYSVIVCMESSGRLRTELLDAMASGLAGVVRRHPADETDEGVGSVLHLSMHLRRFQSRADLLEILRNASKKPGSLRETAAAAGAHVRAGHTWTDRLRAVMKACGSS